METIQDDDNGHAQMRYSHDGFGKCPLLSIDIPSFVYFKAIDYVLSLYFLGLECVLESVAICQCVLLQ